MSFGFFLRRPVLLFCAAFSYVAILALVFIPDDALGASSTQILTKNGKPVLITAQSMFGDSEKQTVNLSGDVQMTFDGQNLRADRVTMDKKNGKFFAEGNMILASPSAYVEGARAEISYEDNTGLIYDGFVKSGQVLFQGKVIRKVGVDKYEADDASYTACTTCPPAWSFSGSRIDAELGAYAYIKSAWFYISGVPFLWLPYLIVPLKSERQTGVLFPSFELDTDGIAIGIPFFWAISRSQDMTLTPKYYDTRGFKGIVNYRYILNEESTGELTFGGFIHDRHFESRQFTNSSGVTTRPGDERAGRWFLAHDHIYSLPGGFINRAKLNLVSDLRYTRDFLEEMKGLGEPSLENRLSLTKNTEFMHSSIEVAYYLNQLKSDPLEGNSDAVHRFPELKQSGIDRSLFDSRVFFKWDFNYVNFAREDFAFDDVVGSGTGKTVDRSRGRTPAGTIQAGSGTFEPGNDLIRAGQRLDLRPEISAPFRIGRHIDVLPSINFRHTQYSFNVAAPNGGFDTLPTRQYVRGRLAARTQFSRTYDLDDGFESDRTADTEADAEDFAGDGSRLPAATPDAEPTGVFQAMQAPPKARKPERLKHEIEPEIAISGIPWLQQTQSSFFGDNALAPIYLDGQPVSNSDFFSSKGLQFDYDDRITQRNVVSTLITNRFIKKSWVGEQPTYRQIVTIKNGTSFEYDKHRDAKENFSDIFTIVDARFDNFLTNTAIRYFPFHRIFNTSSQARVFDEKGNFFQVSFSQNYLITENVAEAYRSRDENLGFALGAAHKYGSIVADVNYLPATYSPIDFRLKSWSAALNVLPPGNCWGFKIAITHTLSEEKPKVMFDFNYIFGGAS